MHGRRGRLGRRLPGVAPCRVRQRRPPRRGRSTTERTVGTVNTDPGRALAAATPAAIADALDHLGLPGVLAPGLRSHVAARIAGPAVTVVYERATERRQPEHTFEAVDTAAPGSVLVLAAGGDTGIAFWGGTLTAAAVHRGLAGAVVDGAVRDTDEIAGHGFPAFARGVALRGPAGRFRSVALNVPVMCAGVTVHPGDFVVAGPDGVLAVPGGHADEVARVAAEFDERDRLLTENLLATGSLRAATRTVSLF
ncbi:RraA family protein [Prauserella endophytica]|uniref:Putative 4-hydroxy-4-methyl-2-oxoglutarate aldolase n=1 Tax=Prauserella endophytica TaxID=1592324 RepID=A0ABY2S5M7_9PSEU|nr:RraA family protein [Prauserella endophytica]